MNTVFERIAARAEGLGWKCGAVPWTRIEDLREAIEGRFRKGLLDEKALRDYLGFIYEPPADLVPQSIFIVAMRALPGHVTFGWKGRHASVVIPPTYAGFVKRILTTVETLDGWLSPEGFGARRPRLPMKTLAVCSGLAEYGRNNICYVEGLGSYMQLAVAVTDMPCEADPWREPKALDRCATCHLCEQRCPTGAITADRFLLHAEKCLTLHNESEAGFPDWIDPSWHNSLIGCMRCQDACPANAGLAGLHEDLASFTEAETAMLLDGTPVDGLPADTAGKLQVIDFGGDNYGLLQRNLSVLLSKER